MTLEDIFVAYVEEPSKDTIFADPGGRTRY
jgi:hypothetical protein